MTRERIDRPCFGRCEPPKKGRFEPVSVLGSPSGEFKVGRKEEIDRGNQGADHMLALRELGPDRTIARKDEVSLMGGKLDAIKTRSPDMGAQEGSICAP